MGNENTKEIDLAQPDGTVHEICKNGGVNGISLTITANGHTVEVPSKIPAEINEEPPSPEVKADSTEYAVLESQSEPAEAEVTIQIPDPSVLIEEVLPKEVLPKEVLPKEEPVSLFSKMFKKKTETEKKEEPNKDEQQSNGKIHEKEENGLTENDGIQVPPEATLEQSDQSESTAYAVLESLSQETEPTEVEVAVQTPDPAIISVEVPAKKGKVSLFNKMFKKKKAPTPEKETEEEKEEETNTSSTSDHQQQNGEILEEPEKADVDLPEPPSTEEVRTAEYVVLESQSEAPVQTPELSVPSEEEPPREERVSLFSKMFKKKTAPAPAAEKEKEPEEKEPEAKTEETNEEQTDAADQQQETDRPQTPDPDSGPERTEEEESELDGGSANIEVESQDSPEEENPVMNFFKTLVAPTKTSKKEAAAADAPKDQPKPPESQPAPATTTTTVAQVCDPPAAPKGMPAPPPPPPEPPRAEPAAKAAKQEEPKPAAKDSPKGKSATNTLTRFFRSKTKHDDPPPSVEEAEAVPDQQESPEEAPQPGTDDQTDSHVDTAEEPQSVDTEDQEQKPDASKASTLEAAAKPAPAPAAAQEEKKPEAKKSLLSFFKPKALLDTVSAAVQAASTSGVELLRKSKAAASEPKAAPAPAAAAAAAEAGPSKEDAPKAAKSTEAPAEAKPAAAAPSGGEEAASPPKKMEKRNSITLFFKNLSQRRSSTDAAAQTDAAPAPSAEKTK